MKEGWEYKKLADVALYSIGLTYKPSDVSEEGTIVLRSSNIQNDKLDLNDIVKVNCPIKESLYVQKDDILMCSRNGSAKLVGKVALIPEIKERMTYGTFMMVIRSVYNPYLFYYFKSENFRNQIKHGEANMINQITRYMLDDVYLYVPPLSEQQRIVDYLDAAFAKIDAMKANAEKALNEAKALFQASLKEMLEPKEGWEEKKLKDVVVSITDGDHQPPPKSPEGIPFITISNIDKNLNKIVFEDTFYVPQSYFSALKEDRFPQNGDVLYTVTGSFGIPVLIDFHKNFCFQRHIALIRPNNGLLSSTYLFYWILSSYATSQAEDTATGAAQRTVSLNSLRNFTINFPPLSEQQSIVATLDSLKSKVDRLQENYDKISLECDALKQAILRQVFE